MSRREDDMRAAHEPTGRFFDSILVEERKVTVPGGILPVPPTRGWKAGATGQWLAVIVFAGLLIFTFLYILAKLIGIAKEGVEVGMLATAAGLGGLGFVYAFSSEKAQEAEAKWRASMVHMLASARVLTVDEAQLLVINPVRTGLGKDLPHRKPDTTYRVSTRDKTITLDIDPSNSSGNVTVEPRGKSVWFFPGDS